MEKNSADILNYLLDIKSKKKEPSKIERDQFLNAWVELAVNEGYSDRAEQYLYNGVSYCGAKPFKKYLDQLDDQERGIQLFFKGKLYGANSDVTFRLLVNLLALLMNDKKMVHLASIVIMRFPRACFNKEHKRLGNVENILLKYFFGELVPNNELTPLIEVGIKREIFITEFITTMEALIENIDMSKLSKNKVSNVTKVKKWINEYRHMKSVEVNPRNPSMDKPENDSVNSHPVVTPVSESSIDDVVPSAPAAFTPASATQKRIAEGKSTLPPIAIASIEALPTVEGYPGDAMTLLAELLSKAGKAANLIKAERIQQNIKIDALTQILESEQAKLQFANQRTADLQDTITELRKKLSAAEGDIFLLRQEIAQRDAVIAEKDAEIAERAKMAEVLSRDRSKQADESLQRLASKIRVEYRDFADVLDVPMSCDLGENLRLQLQSIFDILEKGGMKFR